MNSILQTVDDELTRLYTENNALKAIPNASIFDPIVIDNVHKKAFTQPGNTGNTGGGSAQQHGTSSIMKGVDNSVVVGVKPASAYDNFYFYTNVAQVNASKRFEWSGDFFFMNIENLKACQALEWELELCIEGTVWNMGWQILIEGLKNPGQIRFFDYNNKQWVKFKDFDAHILNDKPVKFSSEHMIEGNLEKHIAITVDGERELVDFTQVNTPGRWPSDANYLHYSFQLDSDSKGSTYSVLLNNGKVRML